MTDRPLTVTSRIRKCKSDFGKKVRTSALAMSERFHLEIFIPQLFQLVLRGLFSAACIQTFSRTLSTRREKACSFDVCVGNRRNVRIWRCFLALSSTSQIPRSKSGFLLHSFSIRFWSLEPWSCIADMRSRFAVHRLSKLWLISVSGTFFHTRCTRSLFRPVFWGSLLQIPVSLVLCAYCSTREFVY